MEKLKQADSILEKQLEVVPWANQNYLKNKAIDLAKQQIQIDFKSNELDRWITFNIVIGILNIAILMFVIASIFN